MLYSMRGDELREISHAVLSLVDSTIDLGEFRGDRRSCISKVIRMVGRHASWCSGPLVGSVRWELVRGAVLIVPIEKIAATQAWLLDRAMAQCD